MRSMADITNAVIFEELLILHADLREVMNDLRDVKEHLASIETAFATRSIKPLSFPPHRG